MKKNIQNWIISQKHDMALVELVHRVQRRIYGIENIGLKVPVSKSYAKYLYQLQQRVFYLFNNVLRDETMKMLTEEEKIYGKSQKRPKTKEGEK